MGWSTGYPGTDVSAAATTDGLRGPTGVEADLPIQDTDVRALE